MGMKPHRTSPKADLSPLPALPILNRLHARLGAAIFQNRKNAARLAEEMKHVEAVLRLLDPSYDVRRIAVRRRYKGNPWFKRGTIFAVALDVLRTAKEPLTTRQIVSRMLADKGERHPQPKALRDLMSAVQASLRNHRGAVDSVDDRQPTRWRV